MICARFRLAFVVFLHFGLNYVNLSVVMKNVILRSISGLIYVIIFVGCILLGQPWFYLLTLFLTVLSVWEYLRLSSARIGEKLSIGTILLTLIFAISVCSLRYLADFSIVATMACGIVILVCALATLCQGVFLRSHNAVSITAQTFLGVSYIALPMFLLNSAYMSSPLSFGKEIILVSLICIWLNDTGAFCVGCTLGRHRLCERLSPKKSWEGFWGGLLFVVIGLIIFSYIKGYNIAIFTLYGVCISVLATIGDLFESMLKRTAGVKDSGKIIPGHGGILDRIDSFLFVAYVIFFMSFFKLGVPTCLPID